MKAVILVCLLVAGTQAYSCSDPPTSLNAIEKLLCSVGDAAKTVGNSLLGTLQQVAIQGATQLGGALISGLQQVAAAASGTGTTAPPAKRNIDMDTILKIAKFAEEHRQLVSDLGHVVQNVTSVTLSKIEGLVKELTHNPNDDVVSRLVAYVKAHNLIQNAILNWIDKNSSPLTAFAVKELLFSHKRETGLLTEVEQFTSQLAGSFRPLVNTLQSLVGGLGDQLVHVFQGQTASNLLDTVKEAASDILVDTLRQGTPAAGGMLAQVGGLLENLFNQQ